MDPLHIVGTVLDGEFRIEKYVTDGSAAFVYQALQQSMGRYTAIKIFKPDELATRQDLARIHQAFVRECQITATLDIPNIAQLFHVGTLIHDGKQLPWLALQWVEGHTLRSWLNRHSDARMTPSEALELLRPIFVALGKAHGPPYRVAHRDIKPRNIIIAEHGGFRDAYLLDFGIAKVLQNGELVGTGLTKTNGNPGFSLRYGASEQLHSNRSGPWTDVHALGLILTELLVGRPAYSGNDNATLIAEMTSSLRPTPGKFGVDVGAWEPVLTKALALNPRDRYQTALEFLDALEQAWPDLPRVHSSVVQATMPTTDLIKLAQQIHSISQPPTSTIPDPPATRVTSRRGWLRGIAIVAVIALLAGNLMLLMSLQSRPTHPPVAPSPVQQPLIPQESLQKIMQSPNVQGVLRRLTTQQNPSNKTGAHP